MSRFDFGPGTISSDDEPAPAPAPAAADVGSRGKKRKRTKETLEAASKRKADDEADKFNASFAFDSLGGSTPYNRAGPTDLYVRRALGSIGLTGQNLTDSIALFKRKNQLVRRVPGLLA